MKAHADSTRWPRLLSEAAAAEYFSISRGSLIALGIETVEIGSKTLYDRFSMDAWVARRLGHDTDDTDPEADDWRADQPGLNGSLDPAPAPAPPAPEREVLSVGMIASRWGLAAGTVYALIHSGKLQHFKLGKKLFRVKRIWVEQYERDHPAILK